MKISKIKKKKKKLRRFEAILSPLPSKYDGCCSEFKHIRKKWQTMCFMILIERLKASVRAIYD